MFNYVNEYMYESINNYLKYITTPVSLFIKYI